MANEVKLKLAIEGGKVVGAELDGISTKLDVMDQAARGAATGTNSLRNMLAGIVTVGAAAEILRLADSCTTLRTNLKLSSNSAIEASVAYERLFQISQQARVSFIELGETYGTIARAGRELGVSQDRLLAVTQSIGMAMTIGGGSAQSMQAALVQLGQGLSSGTLRGEELNSILEQTPRLARALADGMGVSVGQLRSLGEQGKLTAETVINALEKSGPQLAREMDSASVTVGQAWTMVRNSLTKFVGDADSATGASSKLAGGLQNLSSVIDSVGSAIKQHETTFSAIATGLASAAIVSGIAATAGSIATLATAVKGLGVVLLANPIVASLAAIAAAGGAIYAVVQKYQSSAEGMRQHVSDINREIGDLEKAMERSANAQGVLLANGAITTKQRAALRLQELKDLRDSEAQKLAVLEQSSGDNASYNAKEMKLLQDKVAAERDAYAGAGSLDDARKAGKLRNDVIQAGYDDAVKMALGFNKAIAEASSPEQVLALTRERDQRLIANAQETTAALKSFDDQKAAPAREAAKQRLDATIQYYESLQIESTAGEQRANRSLAAAHAAGLLTDQEYYQRKRDLAENDNIAQQALVELEIEAVRRSGLPKKDQIEQLNKFNADLKRLREVALGIESDFVNEMTALDMKLFRAAIDQNAQTVEAQQGKAESLRQQVKDQRLANAEIGLSAREVANLRAATVELAAAELERRAGLIEDANPELARAYRDQAKYMRELATANMDAVQKTAAVDSFKDLWNSVDQTARSVWTNIFQGGQDAFTKLRDTLKATLLDLLYQMTVRKWIFNIVANVTGNNAGSVAQTVLGNGGMTNAASLYSTGSSVATVGSQYFAGTMSGANALGTIAANATGTGIDGLLATNAAYGTAASSGAAAATAGAEAGAVAATAGAEAGASSVLAAIPGWGWAALAALAIFSMTGSKGWVKSTGESAMQFDQAGNMTSATPHRYTDVDNSGADAAVKAMNRSYLDAAKSLGIGAVATEFAFGSSVNSDGLNRYRTGLNIGGKNVYDSGEQHADPGAVQLAASQAVLTALQSSELPKWMQGVFDGIDASKLDQAGVNAAIKSAQDLKSAYEVLGAVPGLDLTGISAQSLNGVKDAFGGVDKMNQAVSAYVASMYSDAERTAHANDVLASNWAKLEPEMSRLGLAIPQTEAEFKTLVSSIDVTTASGQSLVASVLALAPAFETSAQAARAAASNMLSAVQNWGTSSDVRAYQAQMLQMNLADAGLNLSIDQIMGATQETALAYYKSLDPNSAAAKALLKYQQDIFTFVGGKKTSDGTSYVYSSGSGGGSSAATQVQSALQQYTDAIFGEVKRLRGLMEGTGQEAYAAAQARLAITRAQAEAGSQEAYKALPALSQAVETLAQSNASSYLELQRIRGRLAADLEGTATVVANRNGLTIPAFASGGTHLGGWAMVGEQGPELAYMPPARVYNAGETRSILSGASNGADGNVGLVTALRTLANRIENIESNTEAGAIHGASLVRMLARVIPDDDDVITVRLVVPKGEFVPVRTV